MKTLDIVKRIYQIHPWNPLPAPLKEAFETSTRMERATQMFPMAPFWNSSYNTLKKAGKEKRQQKRVRFGDVKKYQSPKLDETTVVPAETTPVSDKINREIASRRVLEKYLFPLFMRGGSLRFSPLWNKPSDPFFPGENPALCVALMANTRGHLHSFLAATKQYNKVTLAQLIIDLRFIMHEFEKNHIAILGYRSSWKLLPTYEEQVLRRASTFSIQRVWTKTGKKFALLPKIRLYLIKVCNDPVTAARHIQQTWRRRRPHAHHDPSS